MIKELNIREINLQRINFAWILVISLIIFGAIPILINWGKAINYPFVFDYGEGPLFNQAILLSSGKEIYQETWEDYPFTMTNYPPLFVIIYSLIGKFFELSIPLGRFITAFAAFSSAILLGLIIKTLTHDNFSSILGTLLLFVSPIFVLWSKFVRVDILALSLSLAGIFIAIRWRSKNWSPILSALFLICAIYTKQTFLLAAPLALFGWHYFQVRNNIFRFISTLVIGSLFLLILLFVVTNGGFINHTFFGNQNQFSLVQSIAYLLDLFMTLPIILGIVILEIIFILKQKKRELYFTIFYLIGSFGSALAIGKIGAGVNYLLEFLTAICLLTGVALYRWSLPSNQKFGKTLIFLLWSYAR